MEIIYLILGLVGGVVFLVGGTFGLCILFNYLETISDERAEKRRNKLIAEDRTGQHTLKGVKSIIRNIKSNISDMHHQDCSEAWGGFIHEYTDRDYEYAQESLKRYKKLKKKLKKPD